MRYTSNISYNGEMMLVVYSGDSNSAVDETVDYTLIDALNAGVLPKEEIEAIKRLTTGETGNFFCLASEQDDFESMYFEGCFYVDSEQVKVISGQHKSEWSSGSYIRSLDNTYYVVLSENNTKVLC